MTRYPDDVRAVIPQTPTRSSGHLSSQPRRVEASSTTSAAAAAPDLGDFEMSRFEPSSDAAFDAKCEAVIALIGAGVPAQMITDAEFAASQALSDLHRRKAGRPLTRDERRLDVRYRAVLDAAAPNVVEQARSKGLLPSTKSGVEA